MCPFVEIEVEDNANTYGLPMRRFSTKGEQRLVAQIKMDTVRGRDILHWVVGWSSEAAGTACAAYSVPVEDSGAALSYLVYGGDWGLRFKPVGLEEAWSLASPYQFGEPCLLLGEDPNEIAGPENG